jgi:hypothetical protein
MAVPDRCYHCGRRGELEQHAVYDAEIAHLGDGWRQRVEERRLPLPSMWERDAGPAEG